MAQPSPDPPSASSEHDRELVEKALAGHEASYAALVEKYRGPLGRHISRLVRDASLIDDLVQEAFIKAFSSLPSYSPAFAFSTWLYKIASNHAIDHLRRKKLPQFSIDQPLNKGDGDLRYEPPDNTYRPDRNLVEGQRTRILTEAIDSLPEKYNRVIVMRHQEELSYEEIAEELDLPLGTVKAHIFRARALLYKQLKERRGEF
ncbi:RNA polymerase sigma factor RpoE [soil metagenome]